MQVDFTYLPEDFRELQRVHGRETRGGHRFGRGIVGWIVFVVAAVILILVIHTPGHPQAVNPAAPPQPPSDNFVTSFGSAGIWVAVVIGAFVFVRFARRKAISKAASVQRPQSLVIQPADLTCYNGPITSRYEWSAFDRIVETPNGFFLRIFTGASWVIIPKRSIPTPEFEAQIRHLLHSNIGPATGAFPVIPIAQSQPPG